MTKKKTKAPTKSSKAAIGINVFVTGPSVFKSLTTDREGAGAVASAKHKGQIEGRIRQPKDDAEHHTNHQEGPQRLGDGGDQNLRAGLLHVLPDQLCTDHQSEGALQNALQHIEPLGVQNRISQQIQRVGTNYHAGNQPPQNRGQFQLGDQFAGNKRNRNRG